MQNTNAQRAELLEMVIRWQNSGLTQTAFCTNKSIAYHVFHYWFGFNRSNQHATDSFILDRI